MLPDWMIEELEKDRRNRDERARPQLELELPVPDPSTPPTADDDGVERGVVTIQIL